MTSSAPSLIANNPKAFHDYSIEERLEAGLVLEGWEVKAIRAGRVTIKEAYVIARGGKVSVVGMTVSPLGSVSTHVHPDPTRSRTLLLHAREISKLSVKVDRAGYTLVPLNLHLAAGRIKMEIGLAKGKAQHDKREADKTRDWNREKARLVRSSARTIAQGKD